MDFISKWLTIRYKQKYLGQRYQSDEAIGKLVHILLAAAVSQAATCIIFGEPTEPHPPLDDSLLSPQVPDPKFDALMKDAEIVTGTSMSGAFGDSAFSMIPVWMKISGQWYQSEAIHISLLHKVIFHIEGLFDTEPEGIGINVGNGKTVSVGVALRCEKNYNYAIDLTLK